MLGLDATAVSTWLTAGEAGDDDDAESADGEDDDEDSGAYFLVWPENWSALELFLRCDTQWVWTMGACTGLDYLRVEAVMRMDAIPRAARRSLLDDLRVMERAALPLINARD